MYKPSSPEDYLANAPDHYRAGLTAMREVLLSFDLEESIKWNIPVYGYGKKNVASLFYAKAYLGVWFGQGALLSDPDGILVNASPGKTVSQRQLRFASQEEVDPELLRGFLTEAIQNQKEGLELAPVKAPEAELPPALLEAFRNDPELEQLYSGFTPYKQREFCESINDAKREVTKARRLQKVIEHIREGSGLSDKYRK
ncbi:hypothetical protein FUA23_11870 [Neolewinella aurantiaca]|uniref:YdhG-like domain-containing protein n=1 Tax=Neolewinella aurantiaca TaxID=2602767 RepID=A0A5C7FFV5_9BACT|nr:YdeI/OmpD-associated family protein [Neolewinella aurantiaca]TXF89202.1 hypothetical protein FUA23_11870 [Neolewinella aurantiaca]